MSNTTHHTANINSEDIPAPSSPTLKLTWLTPRFECVLMEDASSSESGTFTGEGVGGYS
ncbi:MAG: hypothetical protein HW390_2332 [Candidatus Brocadiaceae bacterium]|nr:hypothetical protein [Candidatus Brocadiaceae bacterium]